MSEIQVNTINEYTGANGVTIDGVLLKDNKLASGTGNVLQVVQGTLTSEASTTSSTYSDTGLSVSITPSSTSSKILISFAHHTHYSRSFDYGGGIIKLLRDTTNIDEFRSWMQVGTGSLVAIGRTLTSQILDSPSTTSAITYKTQYKVQYAANSETFKVAYESATYNTIDTITAIEIGG